MIAARALRVIAIAIAVAGVADPTLTREAPLRQPLAIVIGDAAGVSSGQRLRALLEDDYDVAAYTPLATSGAAACPQHGGCILVSDGQLSARLTAGSTVIGGVRAAQDAGNVAVTHVSVPGGVHLGATSVLHVRTNGNASRVEVFDDDVLVGAMDVNPRNKDGELTVPWMPIDAGARRLTVRAGSAAAHVGVFISDVTVPVLFYEPEATWLGTFVRRALESDLRFNVVSRTRLAPAVAVTRGGIGQLTRDALQDIGVVLVTAPDLLSRTEVDLLERFVRIRGGSVIVIPDRLPRGAVMRLMADVAAERRENEPTAVGALKATEIVTFSAGAPGVSVIESAGGHAVVVSRAIGRGRVVASGALDAWRYRDGAFNGFWTALAADAAFAAGPTLALAVDPPVLTRGGQSTVTAEWRTLDELPAEIIAEALLTCGDQQSIVRLWPGARPGMFTGVIRLEGEGDCELQATLEGPSSDAAAVRSTRPVKLENAAWAAPIDVARLDAAIRAHGGVVVTSGDEATLAARVRARMPPPRQPQDSRPMHSAWWILPFTACLGGEWWLRRRAGLR